MKWFFYCLDSFDVNCDNKNKLSQIEYEEANNVLSVCFQWYHKTFLFSDLIEADWDIVDKAIKEAKILRRLKETRLILNTSSWHRVISSCAASASFPIQTQIAHTQCISGVLMFSILVCSLCKTRSVLWQLINEPQSKYLQYLESFSWIIKIQNWFVWKITAILFD